MFPTIGDLIFYLFHIRITFPIQTLGFFIALSFFCTYFVFVSEFKRYETTGKIHAFTRKIITGRPASLLEITANFLLGFLFGYKVLGAVFNYAVFANDPRGFILSTHGNIFAGLVIGLGFAIWVWVDRKKHVLASPQVTDLVIHPYQLMPLIVFSVGFFGFIGAKLFDTVEHISKFIYDPVGILFSANGFTYYGGLIFGALTYLYIGYRRGMKLVHLADIGSPGMMLAYGIGRIGCQLSGDGDWGIYNTHPKPFSWLPDWAWSFRYPHNSINEGFHIPGCAGNYCNQLLRGVYPTSFYEASLCIGLFLLMWAFRKKIVTPGFMFFLYLVLNGGERFLIEQIRVNPVYHILGLALTQAEIIALLMIIGGLSGFIALFWRRNNGESLHKQTSKA